MWLKDIAEGATLLRQLRPDCLIEKIVPSNGGIAFYTTYHSRILYIPNNQNLIERFENGEVKILSENLKKFLKNP